MPPNIPGFYFDAIKNRYFKVQSNSAASSPSSPWTATAVKRRRSEAVTAKKAQRRKHQTRNHVKRSRVHDLWTFSGCLDVQTNGGSRAGGTEGDVKSESWAMGLEEKGRVRFYDDRGDGVNLGTWWVEERGDKGVMWAANDSVTVQRHIVQTDDNGYIEVNNALHAPLGGDLLFEEHQSGVAGLVSCLVYDSHRKQLFVTSKRPDDHPRFSSLYYDNPDNVVTLHRWDVLLEEVRPQPGHVFQSHPPRRNFATWSVNTFALVPRTYGHEGTLAFLGTDHGIVPVPSEPWDWSGLHVRCDSDTRICSEIFAIDFQPVEGSSLVFAGGRSPNISSFDPRGGSRGDTPRRKNEKQGSEQKGAILHGSPVSNLKFVNEHQLLAAGPRSKMALYDIRFVKDRPVAGAYHSAPLLTFPTHKNEARFDLGLDVSPDGRTAVAAQDDGKVKVFSLGSGREVACPVLGEIGGGGGGAGVVRRVAFGMREGDLFVGLGGSVVKYGFGTNSADVI